MGWYFNGCGCIETREPSSGWDIDYEGDIRLLHEYGFDGVKFDGCGMLCNMTSYAALMNATGKAYEIENCHWGDCTEDDASSCPTKDWCPFNWYRTSGDSNNNLGTWYSNLQTTIRFNSDWEFPLSRPGCWAYPDMLQVGRLGCSSHTQGCPQPQLFNWSKAHFAAFSVVSSPLVLSINPTDTNLEPILDIIGNKGAMAVNQAWAGHPGTFVKEYPPVPPRPHLGGTAGDVPGAGVGAQRVALPPDVTCHEGKQGQNSGPLRIANMTVLQGVAWCKNQPHCGGFSAEVSAAPPTNPPGACAVPPSATEVLELQFFDPYGVGRYTHPKQGVWAGWKVGGQRPVAGVQLWAKPLGNGRTAALFINGGLTEYTASITLSELNITASPTAAISNGATGGVTVADVWTGVDAGAIVKGAWSTGAVPSLDSRFVIFTVV